MADAETNPHRRPTWRRVSVCAAILGVVLAGLSWLACSAYVRVRVRREVAELRRQYEVPKENPRSRTEAFDVWVDAASAWTRVSTEGCRALPALIAELDESADPRYLSMVSTLIGTIIVQSHLFERGNSNVGDVIARTREFRIESEDDAEERRRKIALTREWWVREGAAYHQWWRFWSTSCRAPLSHDW